VAVSAIQRKERFVITNATLEDDVKAALALDPRVSDPVEIAVAADDGYVTLRGTVGSFAERRAAVKDTRAVDGVYEVNDEIKVRLLDEYQREDTEIRGAALQILMWDSEVPAELIDVKVEDGWVTLTGNADFQFQSDAAFDDVAGMYGVVGVANEIRVTTH
jgi:osmotically-inducible protein OsmY